VATVSRLSRFGESINRGVCCEWLGLNIFGKVGGKADALDLPTRTRRGGPPLFMDDPVNQPFALGGSGADPASVFALNSGYIFFIQSGQMLWLNSACEWSRT
jgi:hypothetical protein